MQEFLQRYYREMTEKAKSFYSAALHTYKARKQEFMESQWGINEFLLLFALALVGGMAAKVIAIKTFTIGYEDYKIQQDLSVSRLITQEEKLSKGPLCEE